MAATVEKDRKDEKDRTEKTDKENFLVEKEKMQPLTVVVSDISTLILLLDSSESAAQVTAMTGLERFAETSLRHRAILLNERVLVPLLKLTYSSNPEVKKSAIGCIAATTEVVELHPDMCQKNLIQRLIALLAKEEPVQVIEEAALALSNISKDFANKAEVRKSGGLQSLIQCLNNPDPDVQKNVAFAIAVLLEDFAARTDMRLLGGIVRLLENLSSEHKEIQENILLTLSRCAEDFACRIEIRKLNGLKKLVDMLTTEAPELHHLNLLCIANCLEDKETNNSIADMNFFTTAINLLGHEDPKTRKYAALAISRTARLDRNQVFLRDGGAIPILIQNIATSPDPSVIGSSALAAASLAKNELNQSEFLKSGAIEILIRRLTHEDVEVRRNCLLALSCCVQHIKIRSKFKSLEGMEPVIRQLSSQDVQTVINALECISNLAEDAINRTDITKFNGVAGLVELTSHADLKVQSCAAMAIARCMQEPDSRNKLKEAGGLQSLISLLGSKDLEIARNAAWALSSTITTEPMALECCRSGALGALLALTKDANKKATKFAADALNKLLNHHLPAKYWLTNNLTEENVIKDGFYDIGSVGGVTDTGAVQFPTLDELKSRPVDKKREIILVDATEDKTLSEMIRSAKIAVSEIVASADKTPGSSKFGQKIVSVISNMVVNAMGKPVDPTKLNEVSYKFKIQETKLRNNSNVVLLGDIASGFFYHRALLFKVLLDRSCNLIPTTTVPPDQIPSTVGPDVSAGPPPASNTSPVITSAVLPVTVPVTETEEPRMFIPVQLIRGEYGRAWNTVKFRPKDVLGAEEECVVDLMFQAGRLLEVGSQESSSYQRIAVN